MIEKREKEWQELEAKARQIIENPRLLPKDETTKQFEPILHLWISPTFTPEKHWFFYKPRPQINPQPKPFVRQMIWQKEGDFQRLNNLQEVFVPEPTFEIKTVEIEWEFYRKFRSELSKIKLLPFIEVEMSGRDGDICGVETLDLFYSGKITWWSECPSEWKELVDWFEKIKGSRLDKTIMFGNFQK